MPQNQEDSDLALLDRGRMVMRSPFLPLFLQYGLGGVQAVMDFRGGELFKEQGPRSVSRFSLVDGEGKGSFFLKRHRRPPLKQQIRELLNRGKVVSGGRREWDNIWKIRQLGIPTVDPVGFGEKRRWGWEVESFLISQELTGACRLSEYLPRHFLFPLDPALLLRKRHLVRQLALLVRRMHEGGLFHRDLYLGHLFVRPQEEGGLELYLMDLQRVIPSRWRAHRWRVKDLASLNFSAPKGWFTLTDRLRFYTEYRGITRLSRSDKDIIRRISRKSHRISSHTRKLLEKGEIQNAPWGFGRDAA